MSQGQRVTSSLRRRQLLLDSAIELLTESGTRGVTHRLVAERAGLPTAASRHYFGTDAELLHAALRHRLQRWQAEISAAFEVVAATELDVRAMVERYFQARRREDATAYLAVFNAAFTIEEVQPAVLAATRQVELLLAGKLARMGFASPDRLARTMLMMMFGAATRRRDGGRADDDEAALLRQELSELVNGHVAESA